MTDATVVLWYLFICRGQSDSASRGVATPYDFRITLHLETMNYHFGGKKCINKSESDKFLIIFDSSSNKTKVMISEIYT